MMNICPACHLSSSLCLLTTQSQAQCVIPKLVLDMVCSHNEFLVDFTVITVCCTFYYCLNSFQKWWSKQKWVAKNGFPPQFFSCCQAVNTKYIIDLNNSCVILKILICKFSFTPLCKSRRKVKSETKMNITHIFLPTSKMYPE